MRFPASIALFLLLVAAASATPAPADKNDSSLHAKPETIRVSEKRCNLLLFQAGGEVIAGNIGKSELTATADAGTVISTDEGRAVLHSGRWLVMSGKTQLDIGTRLGTVRLARNSSAVMEVRLGKPVCIKCTGGRATPLKFRTRGRLGQVFWLKPGEELVLSDRNLPRQTDLAADGLERKPLPAPETRGLEAARYSFKLGEFINLELKNQNTQSALGTAAVRRMVSNIVAAATAADPSFKIHLPAPSTDAGTAAGEKPVHIFAAGGSEFAELPDKSLAVRKGSFFVHPSRDLTVRLDLVELKADKDSLFSAENESGGSRIAAFSGPGDLHLVAGSRKFDLSPGQEALITNHEPAKAETLPGDGIGRRRPTTTKVRDDLFVSFADVSIVTLINSADHLRGLRQPNSAAERKILDRLVRTAAAVDTTTRSRGPYRAEPKRRKEPKPTPTEPAGPAT